MRRKTQKLPHSAASKNGKEKASFLPTEYSLDAELERMQRYLENVHSRNPRLKTIRAIDNSTTERIPIHETILELTQAKLDTPQKKSLLIESLLPYIPRPQRIQAAGFDADSFLDATLKQMEDSLKTLQQKKPRLRFIRPLSRTHPGSHIKIQDAFEKIAMAERGDTALKQHTIMQLSPYIAPHKFSASTEIDLKLCALSKQLEHTLREKPHLKTLISSDKQDKITIAEAQQLSQGVRHEMGKDTPMTLEEKQAAIRRLMRFLGNAPYPHKVKSELERSAYDLALLRDSFPTGRTLAQALDEELNRAKEELEFPVATAKRYLNSVQHMHVVATNTESKRILSDTKKSWSKEVRIAQNSTETVHCY